ncbi:putative protein TPRXL [Tetranychus urticae]|nr:putative protein TPRXL [Tetranychus urticae]
MSISSITTPASMIASPNSSAGPPITSSSEQKLPLTSSLSSTTPTTSPSSKDLALASPLISKMASHFDHSLWRPSLGMSPSLPNFRYPLMSPLVFERFPHLLSAYHPMLISQQLAAYSSANFKGMCGCCPPTDSINGSNLGSTIGSMSSPTSPTDTLSSTIADNKVKYRLEVSPGSGQPSLTPPIPAAQTGASNQPSSTPTSSSITPVAIINPSTSSSTTPTITAFSSVNELRRKAKEHCDTLLASRGS